MNIACFDWGSLIWNPANLLNRRRWFSDGPMLGVEFVRESKDKRLTLVLIDEALPVRTLWTLMATTELEVAKRSLQAREGVPNSKYEANISSYNVADSPTTSLQTILYQWAIQIQIEAVIWTSLQPKFGSEDRSPSEDEAVNYLRTLSTNERNNAEMYIRKAPLQIDTNYRRRFEREFGWSFIPS